MLTTRHATHADIPQLLPLMEYLGHSCKIEELESRLEVFSKLNGYQVVVAV